MDWSGNGSNYDTSRLWESRCNTAQIGGEDSAYSTKDCRVNWLRKRSFEGTLGWLGVFTKREDIFNIYLRVYE
jgi:hypothetical protein